ncbi:hypothetical protein MBH78_15790 [Oceanimonas sp. NS1]|nr:hypothetical protein [Oceanimonas sp. NS1]
MRGEAEKPKPTRFSSPLSLYSSLSSPPAQKEFVAPNGAAQDNPLRFFYNTVHSAQRRCREQEFYIYNVMQEKIISSPPPSTGWATSVSTTKWPTSFRT